MNFFCNISQTDRINRAILGGVLIFTAIIDCSRLFYAVCGFILLLQAFIGWCAISWLLQRCKKN